MPRKMEYLKDATMNPDNKSILIPGLKNFSGLRWSRNGKTRGQRAISIRLTQEQADYFVSEGCNVNVRPPREEGDVPEYSIKLIISFKPEGDPFKYLDPTFDVGTADVAPKRWDETMIDGLDSLNIYYIEVFFSKGKNPAQHPMTGKEFYPLYLQNAIILYKPDFLASRLADINAMYGEPQLPEEVEPF